MKRYTVLGSTGVKKFLREYWQKRPLLIRQAMPGVVPALERDALFALAANPQVESRLVVRGDAEEWSLQHGPVRRLPSLRKKGWTLLVQGANLHDDAAARLMEQFRFIPDARLDDLMISFATDQGGVGPHFDSYDVFLLQVHGRRRWRISAQQDLSLQPGLPLKILQNFQPEQEFLLEPGDMLYLPPHYAHDGVAEGESMTYSVGFRAPAYQELGDAFLQFLSESLDLAGRYTDPDLQPTRHPAEVPAAMVDKIFEQLRKIQFGEEDVTIFLGEYLSELKAQTEFQAPLRPLSRQRFVLQAQKRGVCLARQSRLLYRGAHVFINGESFRVQRRDQKTLRVLADTRNLSQEDVAAASEDVLDALHIWYEDGWLKLI